MSKLVPIGLGVTFLFGMALDSPGKGSDIAFLLSTLGLIIAASGQATYSYMIKKRTHRRCNSYKFK